MKIGVCIVGAIIQDESMLYKAINSVESLTDWDEKVILMDGLPDNGVPMAVEHYDKMLENLKIIKSKFDIKCFDENIYFKNMLRYLLNNYDCDFWLVIQDDVVIEKIDVWAELGAMDALEANIISYPHKKILKSNHWFDIIDDLGNGYVASHGWSERCFLMKSSSMKKLIGIKIQKIGNHLILQKMSIGIIGDVILTIIFYINILLGKEILNLKFDLLIKAFKNKLSKYNIIKINMDSVEIAALKARVAFLEQQNEELKEQMEENQVDLDDYKIFCDAFDVDCAQEAIRIHWRNISDECKEELIKKGYGV